MKAAQKRRSLAYPRQRLKFQLSDRASTSNRVAYPSPFCDAREGSGPEKATSPSPPGAPLAPITDYGASNSTTPPSSAPIVPTDLQPSQELPLSLADPPPYQELPSPVGGSPIPLGAQSGPLTASPTKPPPRCQRQVHPHLRSPLVVDPTARISARPRHCQPPTHPCWTVEGFTPTHSCFALTYQCKV
ncbi:hypothetical protein Zm00014a_037188 [Zea mays]|uniref:Uncharacterized protein n=1 Tax=Zea mays TaxID=4577 RepID=A0A3L6EQ09_MAIZE|nr:hypothetical protein Zm00014a_037188 [Zea mays]